jgi:hypothetical protein
LKDEENDPDWLADEAVVLWVTLLVTVAVVPDAVFVSVQDADPEPPATSLSSDSVSSIKISIILLLVHHDG